MGCIKEGDSSDYQATHKTHPPDAQNHQDSTGDPVNVVTGAFTLSEQDISFPTQRLRLELTRHYNNQLHEADPNKRPGPLGYGWTHSLHLYLEPGPLPGQISYVDDKGTPMSFRLDRLSEIYTGISDSSHMQLRMLQGGGFALHTKNDLTVEFEVDGSVHKPIGKETQKKETEKKKDTETRDPYLKAGPQLGQITYVDQHGTESIFEQSNEVRSYVSPPGAIGMELTQLVTGDFRLRQIDGLIAEFDALGRISRMLRPGPKGESHLDFHYDENGRLIEAAGAGGHAIRLEYQGEGSLIRGATDHTGRRWRYRYNKWQELVEVRDPAGRIRHYDYQEWDGWVATNKGQTEPRTIRAMNRIFRYINESDTHEPSPVELINQYTSDRRVYCQTDAFGNKTRFEYNRFTRTTYVTDPAGWTTVYCYDEAGNTTKVRRPGGGITEYIFDAQRNLIAEIDQFNNRTEYATLKENDRLNDEQDFGHRAIANRSEYVTLTPAEIIVGYDSHGNRPLIRDALGNTTYFYDYNRFGKPGRIVRPDGSEIHITYEETGGLPIRMEQEVLAGRSETLKLIQEWEYDRWGNMVRQVEWAKTSTSADFPKRVRVLEYDVDGHQPLSMRSWIERGGQGENFAAEERYEWDNLGRLVALKRLRKSRPDAQPQEFTTRFGYDTLGRQIWVINPERTATCWILDLDGRVVESFQVAGAKQESLIAVPSEQRLERRRWSYDAMGREISFTDPVGAVTTRKWDERGLCTALIDPLGHTTEYEYDRDENLIVERTVTGYETRIHYELEKPVVSRIDSLGQRVMQTFDAVGRLQTLVEGFDGKTSTTSYTYNSLGQPARAYYDDGTYERLIHDEQGNLIQRQRGQGKEKALFIEAFSYDALGRLTDVEVGVPGKLARQFTIQHNDQTRGTAVFDALGNKTQNFYDTDGNLIRKIDAEGRILQMKYNGKGRLLHRQSNDGSVESLYQYDTSDRLLQASEGQINYRWRYDASGRLVHHEQTIGTHTESVIYKYDMAGRLTSKQLGQDWWMRYHYSPATSFVSQIELPGASVNIKTDSAGRTIEERWNNGGYTAYSYQPDGSLISLASFDEQKQLVFGQQLARDSRGRPISETRQYANRKDHYTYTYDSLDRLTGVGRKKGGTVTEFRRYTYDERGNRLTEHRNGNLDRTYRYDQANRLIEMRPNGSQIESYAYDRCGNLIENASHQFRYDSANRLCQVLSTQGSVPLAEYQYAATNERALITRPKEAEHIFFDGIEEAMSVSAHDRRRMFWSFQTDILLATSSLDQAVQRVYTTVQRSVVGIEKAERIRDYDPFGDLVVDTDISLPFGFCGKRYDHETSLYYSRARQYDPHSGRFTQPDPMGLVDGTNLYIYASNNPLTYSDVFGFASSKSSQGQVCDSCRVVPGGGLSAHEGVRLASGKLSHTISLHVGQSPSDLLARLNREGDIYKVSTFLTKNDAERFIAETLHRNAGKLSAWLSTAKPGERMKPALSSDFGTQQTGKVMMRGTLSMFPSTKVSVIIEKTPSHGGLPYTIVTAYPEIH